MDKKLQSLLKMFLNLEAAEASEVSDSDIDDGIALHRDFQETPRYFKMKELSVRYLREFCPLDELPLYINHPTEEIKSIARQRLER